MRIYSIVYGLKTILLLPILPSSSTASTTIVCSSGERYGNLRKIDSSFESNILSSGNTVCQSPEFMEYCMSVMLHKLSRAAPDTVID